MDTEALVTHAVQVVRESDASTENVLREMYRAVYAYHESQDPAVLVEFAKDAVATIEVHSTPEYAKDAQGAPRVPAARGRSLEEIFEGRLP